MFPLPTCTQSTDLLPNPSISLANYAQKLNLATPDGTVANTALNELFHTLPHEYYNTLGGNSRSGSLLSGLDNDEDAIMGELYQDSEGIPLTNGVFELTSVGVEDFRKNTKALLLKSKGERI
ncbi:hypothetical protein Leryth_001519 [Lithospermum erythrorhizon]|nr:hypothetical protein Leryth_001519 [Lithospermum erythrorhizon]